MATLAQIFEHAALGQLPVKCGKCFLPVETAEQAALLPLRWDVGSKVIHRRCPRPVKAKPAPVLARVRTFNPVAGIENVIAFERGVHKKGLDGKRCMAAADMWTPKRSGVSRETRWIWKPPHICTCGLYAILHGAGYVNGPEPVEIRRAS